MEESARFFIFLPAAPPLRPGVLHQPNVDSAKWNSICHLLRMNSDEEIELAEEKSENIHVATSEKHQISTKIL